jgi:hypothetical protein
MSTLVQDDLQSYSVGPGIPAGFNDVGIVFGSEFLEPASPTPAPGYYERVGIVYELFGQIAWPTNGLLAGSSTPTTTVGFYTLSNNGLPATLLLSSTNPTTLGQIVLLQTKFEADGTISLIAPGVAPKNSLVPVFLYDTWMFVQVTASFSQYTLSGNTLIAITADLAINGEPMITGFVFFTSVLLSSTWNGGSNFNQWNFVGAPNGQFFGGFYITNDIQSLPWFPQPATIINALDSQIIVELQQNSPNIAGRITQGIVELQQQPSSRNGRMTQGIVELMHNGVITPVGTGGFYVRES